MAGHKYMRIAKYAESLLLEARRLGKLGNAHMESVRQSYHKLSHTLTTQSGDANHVIRAIWYAVDSYLSTLPSQAEALAVLLHTPAEEVWQRGVTILRRLSYEVAFLSVRAKRNALDLPNQDYLSALALARRFLSHYKIETGAHKTSMQVPYTPVVPIPRQTGLYYLRLYLLFLYYENAFCQDCGADAVADVYGLYCFANNAYEDMEFLHVNIYKLMFFHALFSCYLNYEQDNFYLSAKDISVAEKLLASLSIDEQKEALRHVVLRIPYGNVTYNLCALTALFPLLHDAITHKRLVTLLLPTEV